MRTSVASPHAATDRPPRYEGVLQGVGNGVALGWVADRSDLGARIDVAVVVDGEIVAEGVADTARPDLASLELGDNAHGFMVALPERLQTPARHRILVLAGPERVPIQAAPSFWHKPSLDGTWSDVVFEPGGALSASVPDPPAWERRALVAQGWLCDAEEMLARGPVGSDRLAQIADALAGAADACAALGIGYVPALIPRKRDVLAGPPAGEREWVAALNARLRDLDHVELLDLLGVLRDGARYGSAYHRTDADWNDRGAFFAARALLKEAHKRVPALRPPALADLHLRQVPGYRGTLADAPKVQLLAGEFVPCESEVEAEHGVVIDPSSLHAVRMPVERHLAEADSVHLRVYAAPERDDSARLALVGDSAALALLPWLAERSSRITFFWTDSLPLHQLELELPPVVLHLIRETDLLAPAAAPKRASPPHQGKQPTPQAPPTQQAQQAPRTQPAHTLPPAEARPAHQTPPPREPPPTGGTPSTSEEPAAHAGPPGPPALEAAPATAPSQAAPPAPVAAASGASVESARPDRQPLVVLAAGLLGCGVLLMVMSRHLGFYADEWSFVLDRRGWHPYVFLEPHNGHFSLVPVAIYKILFEIVGLRHSWPYRLVLVLLHLVCVGLIYALASRRAGRWIALVPAGLLLVPGAAYEDLLWAFQIGFVGSLAAGLGALLCLERGDRRGDGWAALLLWVSLACASVGVAFTVGVLAMLLASRSRRSRVWVALGPLALYGLWYLHYGSRESQVAWGNLPSIPHYDTLVGAYGFAGFGGLPLAYGEILLAAGVVWLLVHLWRGHRLPDATLVGIVGAVVFWSLAGLARAQLGEPGASRYVYPSMVFILICLIAYLPRSPIRSPLTLSRSAVTILVGGMAFILLGNLQPLKSYAGFRTEFDAATNAVLGAELITDHPSAPYVEAIDALGSPAPSARQILSFPEAARLKADSAILQIEQPPLQAPVGADLRSAVTPLIRHYHGVLVGEVAVPGAPGKCAELTPADSGAAATLLIAPGRALYLALRGSGAVEVWARRLARTFGPEPLHTLTSSGSPAVIPFPADRSSLPWHIRLVPSAATVVCEESATA
jgi:SGNH hydrolase-like domain, acetyltransferase AlgX